jgi:hypothetical protein
MEPLIGAQSEEQPKENCVKRLKTNVKERTRFWTDPRPPIKYQRALGDNIVLIFVCLIVNFFHIISVVTVY